MEIDEIKRCAWPWAACTVLGPIGAAWARPQGPLAVARPAAVRVPASTGACGSAYEPSFRARARRRSGSRSRPGGMAERSAGAAPRPGGRVGSHAHAAPLRRVGVWPGQPRSRTWTGIWHACGMAAPCGASRIVGWRVGSIAWGGGGVGRCRSELGGLRRVVGIAGRRRGLRPSVRSPTPCVPRRPARRCPAVAPPASPAPAVPHPARRVRGGPKPVHLHATHGSSEAVYRGVAAAPTTLRNHTENEKLCHDSCCAWRSKSSQSGEATCAGRKHDRFKAFFNFIARSAGRAGPAAGRGVRQCEYRLSYTVKGFHTGYR